MSGLGVNWVELEQIKGRAEVTTYVGKITRLHLVFDGMGKSIDMAFAPEWPELAVLLAAAPDLARALLKAWAALDDAEQSLRYGRDAPYDALPIVVEASRVAGETLRMIGLQAKGRS